VVSPAAGSRVSEFFEEVRADIDQLEIDHVDDGIPTTTVVKAID
jgi:hypothetical protein